MIIVIKLGYYGCLRLKKGYANCLPLGLWTSWPLELIHASQNCFKAKTICSTHHKRLRIDSVLIVTSTVFYVCKSAAVAAWPSKLISSPSLSLKLIQVILPYIMSWTHVDQLSGNLSKSLQPSPGTIQASTRSQETDSMRCCFSRVNAFNPPRPWGPWLLSLPARPAPNSLTMGADVGCNKLYANFRQLQFQKNRKNQKKKNWIAMDLYHQGRHRWNQKKSWDAHRTQRHQTAGPKQPSCATKLGIGNSPQCGSLGIKGLRKKSHEANRKRYTASPTRTEF